MPLYYFFLFLIFLLTVFVSNQKFYVLAEGLKVLAYHVFLVQTVNKSYIYYGFFYFIAIIFQLYLMFPLLTKILRNETIKLPFFLLSFFFSLFISKLFVILGISFSGILLTDYLPLFLFGMLIADSIFYKRKLHEFLFDKRLASLCILLVVGIVIYLILFSFHYYREVRTLIAILVFLSLPVVFGIIKHLRIRSLIAFIAYSTYTFFLMHMIFINRGLQFFASYGLTDSHRNWIFIGSLILPIVMYSAYLIQKGYDRISKPFLKA